MTSRLPFVLLLCLMAGATGFSWPWSPHTPKAPPQPLPSRTASGVSSSTKVLMEWRTKPGRHGHHSVDPSDMVCRLDPKITEDTLSEYTDDVSELTFKDFDD
jgi:hypothetical protein